MPEVLDIKKVNSNSTEIRNGAYSWKVELPNSVKRENDLSEHSYLVLTIDSGKINGDLINPTAENKREIKRILGKYGKAFEEMKRLGY